MKRAWIGLAVVTAFFGIGGAAVAADMPLKAPIAPVVTYNWTGLYIGGTVGDGWGSFDPRSATVYAPNGYFRTDSVPAVNSVGVQSLSSNGFTGGFEAGYNLQSGRFVYGIEGDISSFHLNGNAAGAGTYPCCAPFGFAVSSNAGTTWLGTVRGRVGVAANNWLFFATGGAAFTNVHGNFAFTDNYPPYYATELASLSTTKTGYAVGGGIEYGFWGNWSVKGEYLYVDFGTVSTSSGNFNTLLGPFPASTFTHSIDFKANIARAALNYRF